MNLTVQTLFKLAQQAREQAYAPYSNFKVGACIRTVNGQYYQGCNVENASFGLTQCAEGSAITNMILNGERKITDVLVVSYTENALTPCGACRQKLMEFASDEVNVYLCGSEKVLQVMTLLDLLPASFTLNSAT